MFGLAFLFSLIVLLVISAGISLYKREMVDLVLDMIVISVLIYTTLVTIESVF